MAEPSLHAAVLRIGFVQLAVLLSLGCASPGPPRPPSLHVPALAAKLEAQRVGFDVIITWVTPTDTTDGSKIHGMLTAVVCREPEQEKAAPPENKPACDPIRSLVVAPGPASMVDVLPTQFSTGAARLLAYRVELLNDHRRSAGRSDAAWAAAGEAPAPVGQLAISARRGAALIQWQPQTAGLVAGTMELKRILAATATGPSQAKSAAAIPASRQKPTLSALGSSPPRGEVTLTVEGATHDPGGVWDRTVRDRESYIYVAQRITRVFLEGHELQLKGLASLPATFEYRDTFPPHAPTGLVSVPGGGFGSAPSIELSWEPNLESDLLGYNVYRREGSAEFIKLNATPLPAPAYRDQQVKAGALYTYRVTAIDQRRNESASGEEIHESVRP